MAGLLPPRFPRALFIAALCNAGALVIKERPVPRLPELTRARIERRDLSIRGIMRGVGRAIIAAGQAGEAFDERRTLSVPATPAAVRVDARLRAILESSAFAHAIGAPELEDNLEAPWIEARDEPPRVTIFWRGHRVRGDRMVRVIRTDKATGIRRVERASGQTVGGSVRDLSRAEFARAVEAAVLALAAAGFKPSGLVDIRKLSVGQREDEETGEEIADPSAGFSFKGLVATIGLQRKPPIWANATLKRSRARAL